MKTIVSKYNKVLLLLGIVLVTWSCSEDWLKPRPLSIHAPEVVFTNPEGLRSALVAGERNLRHTFTGGAPFLTTFNFSDMAIIGSSDQNASWNLDVMLLPSTVRGTGGGENQRVGWFWQEGFYGIRNVNTVISRIDIPNWASERERNEILGAAYFQRAIRYYWMVHMFGDVPFIDGEVMSPRLDFYTHCRWSILRRLQEELEFAYYWLPPQRETLRGRTTREGAGVLLMKVSKALLDFQRALEVGREIASAMPMMTQRFSAAQHVPRTNLMHDLFSVPAMFYANNTEGLMYIVSSPDYTAGSTRSDLMRSAAPGWDAPNSRWRIPPTPTVPSPPHGMAQNMRFGAVTRDVILGAEEIPAPTPDNPNATRWVTIFEYNNGVRVRETIPGEVHRGPFDVNRTVGRGIARTRPSYFHMFDIWDMDRSIATDAVSLPGGRHVNDKRSPLHRAPHPNNPDSLVRDSWRFPEDLIYNAPTLFTSNDYFVRSWYGRNVVRPANMNLTATGTVLEEYVRGWFHWPHYRIFVPEHESLAQTAQYNGGSTPRYLFRTAEVHLMMAEAYYWLNNPAAAATQLNLVRNRAGALPITAADVNIAMILEERARELFLEEARSAELVRIAFTYAKTGRPTSAPGLNGRVYRLETFSGPVGVAAGANIKQEGYNFFFDWVTSRNGFYNRGITLRGQLIQMSVHHVLWPIPDNAIIQNSQGVINQNIGYPGTERNRTPLIVPPRGS